MTNDTFLADCRARLAFDLLSNTWNAVVLWALRDGPERPVALRERIGGISSKVLTETLRRLQFNGLVDRQEWRDYWAINPRPKGVPIRFGPVAVDVEGVLHYVAHNQAIGFLPASAREFFPRPGLRYRDVPGVPPCQTELTWLTKNRDRPEIALIRTISRDVLTQATQATQATRAE